MRTNHESCWPHANGVEDAEAHNRQGGCSDSLSLLGYLSQVIIRYECIKIREIHGVLQELLKTAMVKPIRCRRGSLQCHKLPPSRESATHLSPLDVRPL